MQVWSCHDLLIPGLTTTISEIGYLLLPSRNMAERLLKWRKSLKQPTNQAMIFTSDQVEW